MVSKVQKNIENQPEPSQGSGGFNKAKMTHAIQHDVAKSDANALD
jgi:hypothetical protein